MTLTAAELAVAPLAAIVEAWPVHPVERYEVVHGWPELAPGEILRQAKGVGIDSKGNVWEFHRARRTWRGPFASDPIPATTVWVFHAHTGQLLKSWGAGLFIMPHGLTIVRDDNVWLTDVRLQQGFKFPPDGRLLMALGEARGCAEVWTRCCRVEQCLPGRAGLNAIDLRLRSGRAPLVDRCRDDGGIPDVANLLRDRGGCALPRGGVLMDLPTVDRSLPARPWRCPGIARRRERALLDPLANGELVEVIAGPGGRLDELVEIVSAIGVCNLSGVQAEGPQAQDREQEAGPLDRLNMSALDRDAGEPQGQLWLSAAALQR